MPSLPTIEVLLHKVAEILAENVARKPAKCTRTWWTDVIAREMQTLAAETLLPNISVWGRQWRDDNCGTHLLDQVWAWIGTDEDWPKYRGLALALECEWSTDRDDRFQDFCKVLDVVADRRLFIGQLRSSEWSQHQRVLDEFAEIVNHHRHLRSKEQVGIILCEEKADGEDGAWVIERNGPLKQVW